MKTSKRTLAAILAPITFLLLLHLLAGLSPALGGATWTGNVPSLEKVGDVWTVKAVIPDLVAHKIVDDTGKQLCIQSNLLVGTKKGAIDDKAIRIQQYTFDKPQRMSVQGNECAAKVFVFAFHGDESLYPEIKELAVDKGLSEKSDWNCNDAKNQQFSLTKWQMLGKDECKAVYGENVSVSYKEFREKVLKTK